MSDADRPVGWHADEAAHRYRYWDGERFAFAASRKDLAAYRAAGQELAGVDFTAPVHSELPPEPDERRRPRPLVIVLVAAAVLAVVAVVLLVVL